MNKHPQPQLLKKTKRVFSRKNLSRQTINNNWKKEMPNRQGQLPLSIY